MGLQLCSAATTDAALAALGREDAEAADVEGRDLAGEAAILLLGAAAADFGRWDATPDADAEERSAVTAEGGNCCFDSKKRFHFWIS